MEKEEIMGILKMLRKGLILELELETKCINMLLAIDDREIRGKIIEILGDVSSHATMLLKKSGELQKSLASQI